MELKEHFTQWENRHQQKAIKDVLKDRNTFDMWSSSNDIDRVKKALLYSYNGENIDPHRLTEYKENYCINDNRYNFKIGYKNDIELDQIIYHIVTVEYKKIKYLCGLCRGYSRKKRIVIMDKINID